MIVHLLCTQVTLTFTTGRKMRTVLAIASTIVCLVILSALQSLDAADEAKGPKVTDKV